MNIDDTAFLTNALSSLLSWLRAAIFGSAHRALPKNSFRDSGTEGATMDQNRVRRRFVGCCRQRISILATLVPFDLEDMGNYVKHRLQVAGYANHDLFPLGLSD